MSPRDNPCSPPLPPPPACRATRRRGPCGFPALLTTACPRSYRQRPLIVCNASPCLQKCYPLIWNIPLPPPDLNLSNACSPLYDADSRKHPKLLNWNLELRPVGLRSTQVRPLRGVHPSMSENHRSSFINLKETRTPTMFKHRFITRKCGWVPGYVSAQVWHRWLPLAESKGWHKDEAKMLTILHRMEHTPLALSRCHGRLWLISDWSFLFTWTLGKNTNLCVDSSTRITLHSPSSLLFPWAPVRMKCLSISSQWERTYRAGQVSHVSQILLTVWSQTETPAY